MCSFLFLFTLLLQDTLLFGKAVGKMRSSTSISGTASTASAGSDRGKVAFPAPATTTKPATVDENDAAVDERVGRAPSFEEVDDEEDEEEEEEEEDAPTPAAAAAAATADTSASADDGRRNGGGCGCGYGR